MVKIDTSEIPLDKLNDPDFLQLHAQIEWAVNDPKWRHAFSIHETGHLIYLTRAGCKDFLYLGPRIVYDPEKNEFNGFPAAVQPQTGNLNPENFDFAAWFLEVAKGHAAGGVFARELMDLPDSGEEQDRANFEAICDSIAAQAPNATVNRDGIWKLAQDIVKQDLRSPAFRKEAWEKAGELRVRLFGKE
jgi:hypothetical protein